MSPVVELSKVSKCYQHSTVVDRLDLALSRGEVLGLFGHNGAGKTTTMKMILGLISPSEGNVNVFGEPPSQAGFAHHRFRLGYLPENVVFYPQLTGYEVLSFFARLKKVSSARCHALLEQVGLSQASGRKVKTYSKGMRQRLGLAQALLTEPSLLLLDEPTVGLDPLATQQFYEIIEQLRHSGCSIILCSHVLPGVEKHIDKAAILSQGRLRAYGDLDQLRQDATLPTRISVSGCFELEKLKKNIPGKVYASLSSWKQGGFECEVSAEDKLKTINYFLQQPGLTDIDTHAPSLEQLYRYYIDDKPQSEPTQSTQENLLQKVN